MLINSNSKLCNYNTCAEIQIIWCPWGEQVRIDFMFHSAIPGTMETTWPPPGWRPSPHAPSSWSFLFTRKIGTELTVGILVQCLSPWSCEKRWTPSYFWPGTETHRTFRSLHLVSGLSGRRYTCRMGIDVTTATEQLFPVLPKCISICDQAGVRKERNSRSRKKTEMGGLGRQRPTAPKSSRLFHFHTRYCL